MEIESGDFEKAKIAIERGADVNAESNNVNFPILAFLFYITACGSQKLTRDKAAELIGKSEKLSEEDGGKLAEF